MLLHSQEPVLDNLRGIIFMVLAMAGFAIEDAFIKTVADQIPPGQILMIIGGLGGMVLWGEKGEIPPTGVQAQVDTQGDRAPPPELEEDDFGVAVGARRRVDPHARVLLVPPALVADEGALRTAAQLTLFGSSTSKWPSRRTWR